MGYISRSAGAWDGGVVASDATVCSSSERSRAVTFDIEGMTVPHSCNCLSRVLIVW